MFAKFVCPNGLPPADCTHIPQLVKNAQGFLSRLVAKSQKEARIGPQREAQTKAQAQAQQPTVAGTVAVERQYAARSPTRTRTRTRQ